ncbi:hypothetical protein [Dactylosporangium matsuzakiense]|uniref:Uncharacterized protein n=1 Tax=Dactylosporangium matsuzakiense TaxID=53360 RepID=A0A9W6KHF1_9ACTN|nr:hypothetical protein [Dactylosporangium matsuzakiense]UWZ44280.1 hypothetical protein Dmats_44060 [Dactylosporangium matsuzakiense]GLK99573.1 hypothetical protein GCM10017581_013140 [Dactylosporangium matsuzakiense]
MARLPGGLPVWRGRRLLGGAEPPSSPPTLPAVDAAHHAALHSVVLDALKFADAAPPHSVHLGGAATVRTDGGFLVIGLPLVWGLSGDELRVLLAHELALPPSRHPDLVRNLLNARRHTARSEKAAARHARLVGATGELLAEAEQVRDATAITAAGGGLSAVEDAARALLKAAATEAGFAAFAAAPLASGTAPTLDTGSLPTTAIVRAEDLHAAWQLRLARWGAPAARLSREDLAARHPGLAEELLTPSIVSLVTLDPDAVPLDELGPATLRTLAAEVLPDSADPWVRLADLPVESYLPDVERRARQYVEAVTEVLGRTPDDRDELAGTLLRRPVDVERARRGLPPEADAETPPPWMGAALLAVVVEYALLRKGWRREHPLLPRCLVAPDSASSIDLNELVRSDPGALVTHLG